MRLQPARPLLEAKNNPLPFSNPLEFNAEVLDAVSAKLDEITLPAALIKERAGPRHIARVIGDLMHNGTSDAIRLRAAEAAANMGGLDKGKEASTIQIVIHDSNVQMSNLFCPVR